MTPVELSPSVIKPVLAALLDADFPAGLRCHGVIDGQFPGIICTDNPNAPTWVVLRETLYGTLYVGGAPEAAALTGLVESLRTSGEVLYGHWPDDRRCRDLFPAPEYEGTVYDYWDRSPDVDLTPFFANVPNGCELRPFDADIFPQAEDYAAHVAFWGSPDEALANVTGFALVRDGQMIAEASAGAPVREVVEVGMATRPDHRHKGYATLLCARLIDDLETRGFPTYWNVNAENLPSVRIARKLGYRTERPYTLLAWGL